MNRFSPHVGEVGVHGAALVREVSAHAVHEQTEARVGETLIVKYHQQGRHQVTHALHVA